MTEIEWRVSFIIIWTNTHFMFALHRANGIDIKILLIKLVIAVVHVCLYLSHGKQRLIIRIYSSTYSTTITHIKVSLHNNIKFNLFNNTSQLQYYTLITAHHMVGILFITFILLILLLCLSP